MLLLSLFRQGGYFDLNEGYLSEGGKVFQVRRKEMLSTDLFASCTDMLAADVLKKAQPVATNSE